MRIKRCVLICDVARTITAPGYSGACRAGEQKVLTAIVAQKNWRTMAKSAIPNVFNSSEIGAPLPEVLESVCMRELRF